MKIHILQENLLKALVKTGRIISGKTQLPILQNVLLATENGLLRITTTNMEISVSTLIGGKVEKEGSVCISSKLFTELVTSLPQETVILEESDSQLTVKTSRTNASLNELPVSEFPPVNLQHVKDGIEMDKKIIKDALDSTLYAAATDDARPLLTGIKVTTKGDDLVFAATDGYRLSVKTTTQRIDEPFDFVVPAKALVEVNKILSEEKNDTPLYVYKSGDGQLGFVAGDNSVLARVIDGEFPQYEKIIPKTHTSRISVDKNELLHAVKSASIFARDNANIVRLHLEKNRITVSANTPQVGQNTVEVEAVLTGEDADIAFNSRFLIDFLGNCPDGNVLFEMTGSLNSGVFKLENDTTFIYVVMPVRVQK